MAVCKIMNSHDGNMEILGNDEETLKKNNGRGRGRVEHNIGFHTQ